MADLVGVLVFNYIEIESNQISFEKTQFFRSFGDIQAKYGKCVHDMDNYGTTSIFIPISNKQVIKVGRNRDSCHIVVNDLIISRIHLILWSIQFDNNSWPLVYVNDNSINGIRINGINLGKYNTVLVNHKDVITFGTNYSFSYVSTLPPKPCYPPVKINNWLLTHNFLGSGAYGSVYIATPSNNEKKYFAVKVIKNISNLVLSQNLIEESIILKRINHPNIIKIFESFVFGDNLYIFQKLACGGDLFSYISRQTSLIALPEKEIIVIIYQTLKILDYLHNDLKIIHRDLKLDNLLMEIPIPFSKIYLCDFGIAKQLYSLNQRTNSLVGTLEYSAPEVFENQFTNYDYKCDMWSLGVICYILCSGISPFFSYNGKIDYVKKAKFNHDLQLSIPQLKNVSSGAKDFITRLIQFNPSERMDTTACFKHPWISENSHLLKRIYQERILLSK